MVGAGRSGPTPAAAATPSAQAASAAGSPPAWVLSSTGPSALTTSRSPRRSARISGTAGRRVGGRPHPDRPAGARVDREQPLAGEARVQPGRSL